MQNGYTQLESLGAAEQFASPQRSHQGSTAVHDSQTPEAEASEGVKLLLQKLKQANATADRCCIPGPCPDVLCGLSECVTFWLIADHITKVKMP